MDNDDGLKKVYDPNAERILRTGSIENDDVTIYTVPAAHNFYLEEVSLSVQLGQNPGLGFTYVYWLRGIDLYYVRDLCQIWIYVEDLNGNVMAGCMKSDHAIFPSGLLIPAGDMIVVVSNNAGLIAEGNISGFTVSDYV